jgi:DNA-binding IscR family transcriptional regulator
LDIYRLFEAPEMFATHRDDPNPECAVGKNILACLEPSMTAAQTAAEQELARVSIADLAADVAKRGGFSIPYQAEA